VWRGSDLFLRDGNDLPSRSRFIFPALEHGGAVGVDAGHDLTSRDIDVGFFCLLAFMALMALWEYYRMLEGDGIGVCALTGMICAVVLLGGGFLLMKENGPEKAYDFELVVLVLFLIVIFARQMFRGVRAGIRSGP